MTVARGDEVITFAPMQTDGWKARWRRATSVAVAISALVGCSPSTGPVPVAVVLRGDPSQTSRLRASLDKPSEGISIRFAELPTSAEPPKTDGNVELAIAEARKQYLVPDVPRCLAALPSDAVVAELLVAKRRALVARVLFWQVACHVAANALPDAKRRAETFAALDLEIPADAEAASPEVEMVLASAIKEASGADLQSLRVTSSGMPLTVTLDGRASSCVTPCVIPARRGTHHLRAEADGVTTETRSVVLQEPSVDVRFAATPAPPEVAAQQWALRYASSPNPDSAASVWLLERAVRARNLVLLSTYRRADTVRTSGALAVTGNVRSRAERVTEKSGDVGNDAWPLVDELLHEGKVVESRPITAKPLFWICLGAAAALAAGATYLLVRPTPTRTEVRF